MDTIGSSLSPLIACRYRNIIFIGMPGVGKTTLGQRLAQVLAWEFVDSDVLLEQQYQRPLQSLIDHYNDQEFCAMEATLLLSMQGQQRIIATGGSAVYSNEAMVHLQKLGRVIYLQLSMPALELRLADYSRRGIANPTSLSFAQLYQQRKELYERYAQTTIECDGLNIEQIIDDIVDAIT